MVIKVRLTAKGIGFEDFQKCQKINELKKSVGGIDPVRWVIFSSHVPSLFKGKN